MERGCVNPAPTQRFNAGFLPGKTVLSSFECFSLFFFSFCLFRSFSFGKIPGKKREKEEERGGGDVCFRASSRLAISSYVRARSRDMPFCSHWQRNNALLLSRVLSSSYTNSTHFLAGCLSHASSCEHHFTSLAIKHAPCFLKLTWFIWSLFEFMHTGHCLN